MESLGAAVDRLAEVGRGRGFACCQALGCSQSTSNAKPFCTEHVELMPYVARLLAEMEERALALQSLSTETPAVQDVVKLLERERCHHTMKSLGSSVGLSEEDAKRVSLFLRRQGLARARGSARCSPIALATPAMSDERIRSRCGCVEVWARDGSGKTETRPCRSHAELEAEAS